MAQNLRYDLTDRPGVLGNYVPVNYSLYHYKPVLVVLVEGFWIFVSIGCILRAGNVPMLTINAIWSESIKSYFKLWDRVCLLKIYIKLGCWPRTLSVTLLRRDCQDYEQAWVSVKKIPQGRDWWWLWTAYLYYQCFNPLIIVHDQGPSTFIRWAPKDLRYYVLDVPGVLETNVLYACNHWNDF